MDKAQRIDVRRLISYSVITSIVLLTIVAVFMSLSDIRYVLKAAQSVHMIAVAAALALTTVPLTALRLYVALRDLGERDIKLKDLMKVSAAQSYASLVVPGFYIGGEMVTISYLVVKNVSFRRAVDVVTLRYVTEVITISVIGMSAIALLAPSLFPVFVLLAAYLTSYLVLYLFVIRGAFGHLISKVVHGVIRRSGFVRKIISSIGLNIMVDLDISPLRLSRLSHLVMFLASLAQVLLHGLAFKIVLDLLNVNASLIEATMMFISYTALVFVSPLPCYAGIGELANYYILSALGLSGVYLIFNALIRIVLNVIPILALAYPSIRFIKREILRA